MSRMDDLLQRADRVLNRINQQTDDFRHSTSVPPIQKNISQVFEQGERLWKKTVQTAMDVSSSDRPDTSAETSLLWGSDFMPSLRIPEKLQAAVDAASATASKISEIQTDKEDPSTDTELELFLRREREQILVGLIEETIRNTSQRIEEESMKSMKVEWENKKKTLISNVPAVQLDDTVSKSFIYRSTRGIPAKGTMSDIQIRFSQTVSDYVDKLLQGGSRPKFVDMCCQTVGTLKIEKFNDLWQQVKIMLDSTVFSGKNISEQRKDKRFKIASTSQALKYLENQFSRHMQMIVYGNLEQARRGGVPGLTNLVNAYLNIKFPQPYVGYEDGTIDGHPIWAFIYFCMRAGDIRGALGACESGAPTVAEFGAALRETLSTDCPRLSRDTETKFNLFWRTVGRTSQDPFKKASFCVLALCDTSLDHDNVADKFEDWLWIRLKQVLLTEMTTADEPATTSGGRPADHGTSKLPLDTLRKQILEDYGERHFASGDSPLLYFTALWLTGQFEAAIDFAYRQSDVFRCHAVHIALAAYESHLLLTSDDVQTKICSPEQGTATVARRLNFARIVLLYVSQFQASNPRDALDYLYFLKSFRSAEKENLFFASVRDLLMETKEFEMLLGYIEPNGNRKHGSIDKYNMKTDDLIDFLARDSEKKGLIETSVTFYDLAQNHTKVLQLLNECICQVVSQQPSAGSNRDRLLNLSITLATRYRDTGHKSDPPVAATFFLLMDIVTFFDLFHESRFTDALDVIRRLKLIPLSTDEVDYHVKTFYMISDEVRRTLPDVLLALMTILSSEFKRIRGEWNFVTSPSVDDSANQMKSSAKAIVMYAGLIPYRMPGDTAARLVQMETLMH